MSVSITVPAFIPKYVSKFKCVGAECEDTCCAGWTVLLDKSTVKKYRDIDFRRPDSKLRPRLEAVPLAERSDHAFSRIKMTPGGTCPFLGSDRLCEIQSRFGADLLSRTCSQYPRSSVAYDEMAQQVLTPSCPEAARLMLATPESMDIDLGVLPDNVGRRIDTREGSEWGSETAARLRFVFVEWIRTRRDLPVWQRLLAIATACSALDQLGTSASRNRMVDQLDSEKIFEQFSAIAATAVADNLRQVEVFGKLFSVRSFNASGMSVFQREALSAVFEMLNSVKSTPDQFAKRALEQYQVGICRLNDFLAGREYLLENYLSYLMFASSFPLNEKTYSKAFFKLLAKYGILRFILALNAESKGAQFTETDFRRSIVAYTRFYEHSPVFQRVVDDLPERLSVLSLRAVGALVRDDLRVPLPY